MLLVGEDLKRWRTDRKLTYQELADEVGVTWNTILRWELPEGHASVRRPTRLTRPLLEKAIRRIEGKEPAAA